MLNNLLKKLHYHILQILKFRFILSYKSLWSDEANHNLLCIFQTIILCFQVSSACSMGVFGFQFGLVVGFFLPPLLVSDHEDPMDIGNDLFKMFIYFAIASTVAAVLVIFSKLLFSYSNSLLSFSCVNYRLHLQGNL